MIRILLYDEEIDERRQLCKQILKYYEAYKLVVQISEFEDHVSVLDALKKENFELVVIAQDGTFSLEVVDRVRRMKPDIKLLWCSDLDFAIRSYDVQAKYFLKKPISEETLAQALKKCELTS